MKWMDRVWALLVLAAAAVLGALLCGHIVGAKQAQTALLLVATTALLVLAVALTCFYTVDDKQQAVVTTFGKVTLAICGAVMLFTFLRMQKYCKPVEYRR